MFFSIVVWVLQNYWIYKFLEFNGNSKSKLVQLEKNIAQNLTCFQGSKGNRIQWLKVNCFIYFKFFPYLEYSLSLFRFQDGKNYTGQVYSDSTSSILPLQGKMRDMGSYSCLWKNNLVGEVNYRNFTVLLLSQPEEIPLKDNTVVICVYTLFAVLLIILTVFIGFKFYYKVNKWNLTIENVNNNVYRKIYYLFILFSAIEHWKQKKRRVSQEAFIRFAE